MTGTASASLDSMGTAANSSNVLMTAQPMVSVSMVNARVIKTSLEWIAL